MAVQVFPDSPSIGMSPRISFSHDLHQNDAVPSDHYIRSYSSSSTADFDFCVFDQQSSSADELFSDGKILPIQIKKKLSPPPPLEPPPPPPPPPQKQNCKATSFWRFKRSTSLNCGSGYARTLCPLPILSRSNSTGSASSSCSSVKRSSISNNQKQSFQKYQSPNKQYHQKPPLKKSSYGSYTTAIKINPVLNVPPANLFGFGSLFSSGKHKK